MTGASTAAPTTTSRRPTRDPAMTGASTSRRPVRAAHGQRRRETLR
jgi:hypothetical protein